jgi:hypothetical protein
VLGQRACLRGGGAGTNQGGRGIERLRLFWVPNPAAARFQGTSCYINLWPLQGIAVHAHFLLLTQPRPSPSFKPRDFKNADRLYLTRTLSY